MLRISNSLRLFLFLALGIYLGSLSILNLSFLVCLFAFFVVFWLYLTYRGRALKNWLFGIVVMVGALLVGYLAVLPEQTWVTPQAGAFTGQVYQVKRLNFDTRLLVRFESSRRQVAVHVPVEANVQVGSTINFTGTISRPKQAPNPGVFCYREYLRRQGVFGVCYPDTYEVTPPEHLPLLTFLRMKLHDNVVAYVRDPGLVLALVLGDRDMLDQEHQERWRRLGISHLLAISGMHVGLVAMSLGVVVKRLPLGPLLQLVIIQVVLLVYIVVAGSGASAWRALLTSLLGGYAALVRLRQDPLDLWATAGWILLLVKPTLLFDLGFTLSFAASGGILLWSPNLQVDSWFKNRILRYVVNSLLISTIAQLSLAPLLFGHFGEMAVLGSLATLVFLPCVILLLIGGFFVALGMGPFGFGFLLNNVMALIEGLEHVLLPFAKQWTLGTWTQTEVYVCWCVFVYAGWRLRKPRLTRPKRTVSQLVTIATVIFFVLSLPPAVRRPLEVTAINVGQGDCYYVRTPSGLHLLIDGGGDSVYWQERGRDVGKERLVPYLTHRQVPRLDYVIVSHPHEDHLFGLLAVLENFEVGMIIDNGHEHTSPTYERYVELLADKGIGYHVGRRGDNLYLGDGITLSVLYPERLRENLPSTHNNNSLLLRLQYGGLGLLFTGDLESAVLYDLAHALGSDLRAQWMKVPHHGSRGSLNEEFYQMVDPNWAMISVGPNSFGHPHKEVTDFLDQRKIIWRTTLEGAETFQVWWGFWGRFRSSRS
ncbi:MAG TPA: DNA internalization-related competence protein ComEC/Rec2 [Firmicutes bacterium]|nr:DNA internalization-related competence protein ComEC/Rec2 [Bacillota bacterium]